MSNKIGLIIKREYLTRVKKKSFIVMTILGPILMAAIMVARIWLSMLPEDQQKIMVVDDSKLFEGRLKNDKNIVFDFTDSDLETAKSTFYDFDHNVILYIPENILYSHAIQLLYKKQIGLNSQEYVKNSIKEKIEDWKLIHSGIDKEQLLKTKVNLEVQTKKLEESGSEKKSYAEVSVVLGFVAGFLIYIFIFLYGTMVLRGVIEEKTNRIIEVIISSVHPFQLMMGKIIGIALVGLTQFLLWVVLTGVLTGIFSNVLINSKYDSSKIAVEQTFSSGVPQNTKVMNLDKPEAMNEMYDMLNSINIPVMVITFIFYFLGGYLLYGGLFAAVGAAVDSEADTQQFMLPITLPLILAIIVAQVVIMNPESSLSFWFSIIPLTSPVVMMVRIPFGVPFWEMALSMLCLVGGFLFTTWMAAKIYRTGILLYGKKVTYKELWKWLFYK